MRSNVLYSSLVGIFLIGAIFGSAFLGSNLTSLVINDGSDFSISADPQSGINFYNLVEIDEGDNDEDKVVTYVYHNFTFTSLGSESVNWDFGDGDMATGQIVSHQYEIPGVYLVTRHLIKHQGYRSRNNHGHSTPICRGQG